MLIEKSRKFFDKVPLHDMPQYSTSRIIRKDFIEYSGTLTGYNHKGPPYESGDSVAIRQVRYKHKPSRECNGFDSGFGFRYKGRFCCVPPTITTQSFATDLTAWGTTGWRRAVQDLKVQDYAQAIGELKDIPQTIRGLREFIEWFLQLYRNRKIYGHNPGDAYLNFQFGIMPFLRDLFSFFDVNVKLLNRMSKLKSRKRLWNRSKVNLLNTSYQQPIVISSNGSSGALWPGVFAAMYDPFKTGSEITTTTTIKRKIWFSCKYRWNIPDYLFNEDLGLMKARMLGFDPTIPSAIEVLYNLFPWSWLLDWFTSVGDAVTNMRRMSQGLIPKYGYVMCTNTYEQHRTTWGRILNGPYIGSSSKYEVVNASVKVTQTTKQRQLASPTGLGFYGLQIFDPSRVAILFSLAIARLK